MSSGSKAPQNVVKPEVVVTDGSTDRPHKDLQNTPSPGPDLPRMTGPTPEEYHLLATRPGHSDLDVPRQHLVCYSSVHLVGRFLSS